MTIDSNNEHLPFVEKFRPSTLDEVVSHNNIINNLKNFIKIHNIPHLLFYGPPGTGKTSTIEAFVTELYGIENVEYMTMNINASEERGIEIVRNKIKDFVINKPIYNSSKNSPIYKFVILDEADAMTIDAQAMLKQVIEVYTYNARFCLICNSIKKINSAIQSRCSIFKFAPLDFNSIKKKIKHVSNEYDLKINNDGIHTLCKISNGDMRKIMHMLQVISISHKNITSNIISSINNYPTAKEINKIFIILNESNLNTSFITIKNLLIKNGYSLINIINELVDIIIQKLIKNKIDKYKSIFILSKLRNVNINILDTGSSDIQIYNIISIFILSRSI
jgi:replication factor C subunit 3/5